jgi:hypothetical protein
VVRSRPHERNWSDAEGGGNGGRRRRRSGGGKGKDWGGEMEGM